MSNPKAWRAKPRTSKPNSRQKRNGLFLDSHPKCGVCNARRAEEAHHLLPKGHALRYLWQWMQAVCRTCHTEIHRPKPKPGR